MPATLWAQHFLEITIKKSLRALKLMGMGPTFNSSGPLIIYPDVMEKVSYKDR